MTATVRTQERAPETREDFRQWEEQLFVKAKSQHGVVCEHLTFVTCAVCGKTYQQRLLDGTSRWNFWEPGYGH